MNFAFFIESNMWFLNEEMHKLYFHSNKYEHRHQVGICHSRTWVHNVCRSYPHLSFHTLTSGFSWIMIEWIKWIRPHSPLILTIKWKETYYRWPMMLQWLQIQYSLMGGMPCDDVQVMATFMYRHYFYFCVIGLKHHGSCLLSSLSCLNKYSTLLICCFVVQF